MAALLRALDSCRKRAVDQAPAGGVDDGEQRASLGLGGGRSW